MSVILYIIDTLRADALDSYGDSTIDSPNLDRFAEESVVFENAFSNSTWTRASVGSLLTGLYPANHGGQTRDDGLADEVDSIAEILSRNGYSTAFIATNPNTSSYFGFGQGFGEMLEMYERRDGAVAHSDELITKSDEVTRTAIDWIDAGARPFFLVLHTTDPHDPYEPPERFDRYMPDYEGTVDGIARNFLMRVLTPLDHQRIRSLYDGEISFNDESFGALMQQLEKRGLADDLLVVVTSDHGEEFWEYEPYRRGHGNALADAQLRVPLMIRMPASDRVKPGLRIDRAVQLVDVAPTILDLLGLPAPQTMDGRSLFDAPEAAAEPLFASLVLGKWRMHSVTLYPYKLVKDEKRHRYDLYDLSAPSEPGRPVDKMPIAGRDDVRERLTALLDSYIAKAEAEMRRHQAAGEVPRDPEKIPERVNQALEALGYVE